MAVVKIIEVVGGSNESSDAAVKAALDDARQTLRNIKAVDVVSTGLRGENLDELRAHVRIAAFEDLWLCQRAAGLEPLRADLSEVYDATETPRKKRGDLPYLRVADARAFMDQVRERALEVLDSADLSESSDPLNANGFVW